MGAIKQLHIDCTPGNCVVGQIETCWMQDQLPLLPDED
jgi:hypothetical protein